MAFELEPYYRSIADSDLIADLRSVALKLGKRSLTRDEYSVSGKFGGSTIEKRFGSWSLALDKAGLERSVERGLTIEDLFANLEQVWTKIGRQPRYGEFRKPLSKYSVLPYERRFGGWRNALEAFVAHVNVGTASEPEFAAGSWELPEEIRSRGPRQPGRRLIMQVLMRDNGVCQVCKRVFTDNGPDYHIDHIFPWIKGGRTVLENLQLLCSKCNLLKGALDLTSDAEIEVQNASA